MDPLDRVPKSLWTMVLVLVMVTNCQSNESSPSSSDAHDAAVSTGGLSPFALQLPSDQLTRLELVTRGEAGEARRLVLEKGGHGWEIVAPITYPANRNAVESMVAVLAEIEITGSVAGDERMARKYGVDEAHGVEVTASFGNEKQKQFVVGRSSQETTYVRPANDTRVLTVRGRCRPIFDKTLDELRNPVITNVPLSQIAGVIYTNKFGVLELVADPDEAGKFVPKGITIQNYHRERASQQVGVLAHLFAKRFVDASSDPEMTALFNKDTPRATLLVRGADGQKTVDVWIGKRTAGGIHLRTSESDQIYLVSSHLETSLVARRSHLERSDEMMRQLKAWKEKQGDAKTGKIKHSHAHESLPQTQVSPEILSALRELARSQRQEP